MRLTGLNLAQPGQAMNFNGMAGNQVLEWADLDSEIKTAGLKNVRLLIDHLPSILSPNVSRKTGFARPT